MLILAELLVGLLFWVEVLDGATVVWFSCVIEARAEEPDAEHEAETDAVGLADKPIQFLIVKQTFIYFKYAFR